MYGEGSAVRQAVIAGFGIALLGSNIYVAGRLGSVERRCADLEGELKSARAAIGDVRTRSDVSNRAAGRTIVGIKEELSAARKAADAAVGEAKEVAERRVRELASELHVREGVDRQHGKELQTLKSELSKVSVATTQADEKIGEVKTEVVAVKTALEADRTALHNTVADLRRVKGDLGIQSGAIATNSRELSALKALGEKNYFDIELPLKKVQSVAGVMLMLKKADPKRLRFTLDVTASDKKTERRDRQVNEPVQFMVSKSKGPYQLQVDDLYELVINEVTRTSVRGYLATPRGPAVASIANR